MIDTAGNPHTDGNATPGSRPRHRPSRHRDPPVTSSSHDNWMSARQTSCRQQTAPPQTRCSKDVTAHPHRPGDRPGRPCPVPARSWQPLSGRSGFSPAFGTKFSSSRAHKAIQGGHSGMNAAHSGGHGRGLPWLAPIRNSCELRGPCHCSHLGSRTCVRGITNSSRCAGLSIRVSPSHPYNAGRAGLGWGGW